MPRLYCGTSGWNYAHWKGRFYPREVPQSQWLSYYCRFFDTVEINNSFYRQPERSTFEKWREESCPDFIFAVKASRYLTHMKKLKDAQEPLGNILDKSAGLGEKRGPILYQLPPYWHVNVDRLEEFLSILPGDILHVFEFRDETWQCDDVWHLLEKYGAAYCVMDAPGLPLHIRTTAPFTYIRMHSGGTDTGSNYTDEHLYQWAQQIERLLDLGDVYVYFNNDYMGYAVENALTLKRILQGGLETS